MYTTYLQCGVFRPQSRLDLVAAAKLAILGLVQGLEVAEPVYMYISEYMIQCMYKCMRCFDIV